MVTKKQKKHLPGITVVHDTWDYDKDPVIVKKVERARATIAKVGLPEDWVKSKKGKSS